MVTTARTRQARPVARFAVYQGEIIPRVMAHENIAAYFDPRPPRLVPSDVTPAELASDPEPPVVRGWTIRAESYEGYPWGLYHDGEFFEAYASLPQARAAYLSAVNGAPAWAIRGYPIGPVEQAEYLEYRRSGKSYPAEPRPSAFEGHPATEGGAA